MIHAPFIQPIRSISSSIPPPIERFDYHGRRWRKERKRERSSYDTWQIASFFNVEDTRLINFIPANIGISPRYAEITTPPLPPTTRYFIIRVSSIERSTDPIPPLMVVDGRWRRWVFSSSCHDTVWSRTLACLPACLFARSLVENITVKINLDVKERNGGRGPRPRIFLPDFLKRVEKGRRWNSKTNLLTRYGETFFFFFFFQDEPMARGILYLDSFYLVPFLLFFLSFPREIEIVWSNGFVRGSEWIALHGAGIDRVIETRMFPVVRRGRKLLPCFLRKIHTRHRPGRGAGKQHCQREQICLERVGRVNIHHWSNTAKKYEEKYITRSPGGIELLKSSRADKISRNKFSLREKLCDSIFLYPYSPKYVIVFVHEFFFPIEKKTFIEHDRNFPPSSRVLDFSNFHISASMILFTFLHPLKNSRFPGEIGDSARD